MGSYYSTEIKTSNFDKFKNIQAIYLTRSCINDDKRIVNEVLFDFKEEEIPEIKEVLSDILTHLRINDRCSCEITLSGDKKTETVKFDDSLNVNIFNRLFNHLLKIEEDEKKDEFLYRVDLSFLRSTFPFYEDIMNIDKLKELCSILNEQYVLTVDPIVLKKGKYTIYREYMTFQRLNPEKVMKRIKNSSV